MMCSGVSSLSLLVFINIIICCSIDSSSAASSSRKQQQQQKVLQNKRLKAFDYETVNYEQIFPKRIGEEAAVVEWGNSAIISAIDAVVAKFGPQPSMGASFEVEAAPVLADPMDGGGGELNNADQVHGNMCVMTNSAGLSGVAMAKIAKDSGAVALMVVNVLEIDNPDYIYSMSCETEDECEWAEQNIDIPVIMISLSSGNVLTTASSSSSSTTTSSNDTNTLSMPDRVRLYAGGDRPFFEDVQHEQPVVYLIHNLLTPAECDALIRQSAPLLEPVVEGPNSLEGITDAGSSSFGIERAFLWRGLLKSNEQKAIDERIEQVTGFPQVR